MENTLRRAVTSVTDLLFPVSRNSQEHNILKSGHEYVTHLPLQMLLYFNTYFSPLWFAASIIILQLKFSSLPSLYQVILIAMYLVFVIIEIVRLYLGYLGNLTERVPELAGSWLLTLLIQTPMILFLLLNEDTFILPLERAVHMIQAAFIIAEVVCGYLAIRTMSQYQVTKFHLQQFTDLEQIPDPYITED